MSNTVDIVKHAQSREFTQFNDLAKEMLKSKLAENEAFMSFQERLSTARGETLKESGEEDEEKEMDEKEEDKETPEEEEKEKESGEEDEEKEDEQ